MLRHFSTPGNADTTHEQLVDEILASQSTGLPLLVLEKAGETLNVKDLTCDSRIQNHFANRCIITTCDDALGTDAVCARLASDLGTVHTGEDTISAVLENLRGHACTLVVLDKLDAIYSPTDPVQQEETEAFLASLATVDELTLVVTLRGTSMPDGISWRTVGTTAEVLLAPETDISPAIDTALSIPTAHRMAPNLLPTTRNTNPTVLLKPALDTDSVGISASSISAIDVQTEATPLHCTSTGPQTVAQYKIPRARPKVFHGRDREVERLVADAILSGTVLLGITGPGGIGKTTLALKLLHDPRVQMHFAKERYFISCEGAGSPDEVLSLLALNLGVRRSQNEALWPAVLDGLRARQRIFLVIDNFETIWSPTDDVLRQASEVFLAQLSVVDELTLVVTTRGSHLPEDFIWANADTAELDTLSSTAAWMTFHDLCCLKPDVLKSETETDALTKLLREIDFMPLAVTLLARLDDLPSRLLPEWLQYYTDVLEADHHDGTRRELSVSVSIRMSLAHLPPEGDLQRPRELLSVCGCLPVGLFPGVSAQLESAIPNIGSSIEALLSLSLVHEGGHGELIMLSPVRHYVSAYVPMSTSTQSAVDNVYMKIASNPPYYKPERNTSPTAAAYDLELPNILHILTAAVDKLAPDCHSEILLFCQYVMKTGLACLRLAQKLLPYLGKLHQTECLALISRSHEQSGELHLAIDADMKACDLFTTLHPTLHGVVVQSNLARNLRRLGRLEESNQHRAQAQVLERNLSLSWATPPPGEDASVTLQRYRDLRERHMVADMAVSDAYSIYSISKAIYWIFAERSDDLGGQAEFTRELENTLTILDRIEYSGDGCAIFMTALAHQYIAEERLDEAEDLLQEAYAILTGFDQPCDLAAVAAKLGEIHVRRNQFTSAISMFETAIRSFRQFGRFNLVKVLEKRIKLVRAVAQVMQ